MRLWIYNSAIGLGFKSCDELILKRLKIWHHHVQVLGHGRSTHNNIASIDNLSKNIVILISKKHLVRVEPARNFEAR